MSLLVTQSALTATRPLCFVTNEDTNEKHNNFNTPPLPQNSVSHRFVNFFVFLAVCFFVLFFWYKNPTFFMAYVTCTFRLISHSHTYVTKLAALHKPHARMVSKIKCMGIRTRRPYTVLLQAYTHMRDFTFKKKKKSSTHTSTLTLKLPATQHTNRLKKWM